MKYRPEIDGLRAVAVIPVIFFHAGFNIFSGGFIGVDVFFVISGYLITSIILSEKEHGRFSIVNFYDRRARRILPALFLVMFASLPCAWLWLFPSDMKDFSQSLVAVSLFSSNILFWQETGYWGVDNELKPLLHTWSLAVEEQYYLLFPIFLLVMWRFSKKWIFGLFLLLAIVSIIISQWGANNFPTANFFLLPTRAWELAIGAGIAFYYLYNKKSIDGLLSYKIVSESLGIVGLFLIGYSVIVFSETTPIPGFIGLVPTVGAGLVILFSSKETLVGKILGSKIPVGIGLLSYSAYLWHQPIFAFTRHRSLTQPSSLLFMGLIMATFILAYLSWKYVEKPFRRKDKISSKTVLMVGLSGSVLFLSVGMAGHLTEGFDGYRSKALLTQESIESKWKINHGLSDTCRGSFTLSPNCRTSDEPEILVWGDSFAMHLVQGLLESNPNAKIIQFTKSVCGPFFDIAPVTKKYPVRWAEGCLEFTENVRKWITENNTIKYVVVSSPFSQYLSKENELLFRNGDLKKSSYTTVAGEFKKTLEELESLGVTPIIFSPPPANGMDLGRCLAKAEWNGVSLDNCNFYLKNMIKDRKDAYRLLREIQNKYKVVRLDKIICENEICKTHFDKIWIYRDKGHLSYAGSAELGKRYGFYERIVNKMAKVDDPDPS